MSRLPIPGQDEGTWGEILNEYLSSSLDATGQIKAGSIDITKLAPNVQAALNKATSSVQSINGVSPINGDVVVPAGTQGAQGPQGAIGPQGIAGTNGVSITVTLVTSANWPPPADADPNHWYVKVP